MYPLVGNSNFSEFNVQIGQPVQAVNRNRYAGDALCTFIVGYLEDCGNVRSCGVGIGHGLAGGRAAVTEIPDIRRNGAI